MIDINDPEVAYLEESYEKIHLVYWSLGNKCTYACSYCPTKLHDGSVPYQFYDVVQRTMEKLPKCQIIFTGGEPTYHPDFEKIIESAPKHVRVSVISNASRPYAFWERVVDKFNTVTLTYHSEFADIERFFKTADLVFNQHKKPGSINVTMIPSLWDKCVTAYNRFTDAGILTTAKPLLANFGFNSDTMVSDYSDEQLAWIRHRTNENLSKNFIIYDRRNQMIGRTNPAELLVHKQTNFKGWTCYTPTQYLYINPEGNMYNTACKQRELVGSIYSDFTLRTTPMLCEQIFCWCFTDIQTKKVKNF